MLYALALEAGLSWKGCATKRRKHYAETLPKRTCATRLARKLGMHRHTVTRCLRRLRELRLVHDHPSGRIEPVAERLYERYQAAKPSDKFKLLEEVAMRTDLNLTDKLVLGKLEKCRTQHGARWTPKAWQLALDLGRHIETVRRSLRKLKALRLVSKAVASTWRGYVSSLFCPRTTDQADEGKVRALLETLSATVQARTRRAITSARTIRQRERWRLQGA